MKSRKLAAGLALLGAVTLPGLHRFYLGQSRWGLFYLLLAWKLPVSRVASVIEALWYLFLEDAAFDASFNNGNGLEAEQGHPSFLHPFRKPHSGSVPETIRTISAAATALRDLEQLRQAGLMTEQEFEQQRRSLLKSAPAPAAPWFQWRVSETVSPPLVDANCASVEDWLKLPNISIHQARTLHGLTQQGVQFHGMEDVAAALNLMPTQLNEWRDRVQFCYYEPPSETTRLNPNLASAEQLKRLPYMTSELTQAWIQQRQQSPFTSLSDLSQRLRLSGETTQVLMHYLNL